MGIRTSHFRFYPQIRESLGCKIILNRQEMQNSNFGEFYYLHFDISPFLKGPNALLKIAKYEHPRAPKSILGN